LLCRASGRRRSQDYRGAIPRMRERAQEARLDAAGIACEATAPRERDAFGEAVPVRIRVYNRGRDTIVVNTVAAAGLSPVGMERSVVLPDSTLTVDRFIQGLIHLRPWWAGGRMGSGMFPDMLSPADG